MTGFSSKYGRLYGVGLGPGDPDLVTIKAAKIIAAAPVVAYFAKQGARGKPAPSSTAGLLIHASNCRCSILDDGNPLLRPSLCRGAARLLREDGNRHYGASHRGPRCRSGMRRRSAFLRILHASLCPAEGSLQCRDRSRRDRHVGVLERGKDADGLGDDVLSVLPGTLGRAALDRHLGAADAVVIIKIGVNLSKIRAAITEAGRLSTAIYVEHGTSDTETIVPLAAKTDDHAPYFATILIPGQGRHP